MILSVRYVVLATSMKIEFPKIQSWFPYRFAGSPILVPVEHAYHVSPPIYALAFPIRDPKCDLARRAESDGSARTITLMGFATHRVSTRSTRPRPFSPVVARGNIAGLH